jgi:predicted nucleic acid-binding protein
MNYLVDTNILTRMADPAHPLHQEAIDAVKLLIQQGHRLHVVAQDFYEFWVVATRPANVNGLGKTAAEALLDLTSFVAAEAPGFSHGEEPRPRRSIRMQGSC